MKSTYIIAAPLALLALAAGVVFIPGLIFPATSTAAPQPKPAVELAEPKPLTTPVAVALPPIDTSVSPVEEIPAEPAVETPAPAPAPAPAPEAQPAPAPAPRGITYFAPTAHCDTNCYYDNSQAVVDAHAETTIEFKVQHVASGKYIAGHNYNGMGDKVLALQVGDTVVVQSGAMAGTYTVGTVRNVAYGAFVGHVGFPTGFAVSTCEWDNSSMRWVDLIPA